MKDYTDFIWEENYKLNLMKRKIDYGRRYRFLFNEVWRMADSNYILNNVREKIQSEMDEAVLDWNFND